MLRKIKNLYHLVTAFFANVYYSFPSKELVVIGVTGTDGKTTTSNLIYEILKNAGIKTALISTLGAIICGTHYKTGLHVTTPSPFLIQKLLKMAKDMGCTHVVIEVTSHALDQNRVWGIPFFAGVLTNITHEHLDYHKTYDNYLNAKLKLFRNVKFAVINRNGEWYEKFLNKLPGHTFYNYSLKGKADLTLEKLPFAKDTVLFGDYNLENILAASLCALKLGIQESVIKKTIREFKPPKGRQEEYEKNGIKVIVDFAHTPNSFERFLKEARSRTRSRLIHVFGSAGERDIEKRQKLGEIASLYDDIIILTAEDPRSEKVEDINSAIKKGIKGFSEGGINTSKKKIFEISDREKAIAFAINTASKNDTIVVTGKGHEESINYGKGETKWSDQEIVKKYLKI